MIVTTAAPIRMDSTLLASATYDAGELLLELEFCDGAIYLYFGVPEAIQRGLLTAGSKGSYFNRQIRNGFRYTRLRVPR